MIKILFHIDSLSGGGAEKVLCNLVNHMDQSKYDITVQTLFPCDYQQYLVRGIRYKYCYENGNYTRYRIEAALGLVYRLHMKDDYDIEVAYLECGPTKVIASSSNRRAKKVAWVHCDLSVPYDESFARKTAKWYRKYDYVACVSEKSKESFIDFFGSSVPCSVIHNVVDDNEILDKATRPLPENVNKRKLTLCAVGRLSAPKNYLRLLKSAYVLHEELFDFDLWFVGDGDQRKMIEDYISEHHMELYVTLFGYQSNPYPYMRQADILVCSSNYEGFSSFVAEGLILGKPIITTDCSGMHELLGDSEYGLITGNSDEDFYRGLKGVLMYSTEELDELKNKSKNRGKTFSTENLVRENERFFESLVESVSQD